MLYVVYYATFYHLIYYTMSEIQRDGITLMLFLLNCYIYAEMLASLYINL